MYEPCLAYGSACADGQTKCVQGGTYLAQTTWSCRNEIKCKPPIFQSRPYKPSATVPWPDQCHRALAHLQIVCEPSTTVSLSKPCVLRCLQLYGAVLAQKAVGGPGVSVSLTPESQGSEGQGSGAQGSGTQAAPPCFGGEAGSLGQGSGLQGAGSSGLGTGAGLQSGGSSQSWAPGLMRGRSEVRPVKRQQQSWLGGGAVRTVDLPPAMQVCYKST